jgi:hypothetical protein
MTNAVEVTALRAEARKLAKGGDRFELWVPDTLLIDGRGVPKDIGMAILVDEILSLGFMPDGLTQGMGGATYRYRRM